MFKKAVKYKVNYIEANFNLGVAYQENRDFGSAIDQFDLVLKANPDHAGAYLHKAQVSFESGKFTQARKAYSKAVKLDPNYATAWAFIGWCYHLDLYVGWTESPNDSLKLAHEAGQKALAIDNQHPYVYCMQGSIHLMQRQYDKAITKLRKSVNIDPNYYGGYSMLALTMSNLGRFEESLELIKKAMRLCPYYPPVFLLWLGRTYFFLDRYDEAIAAFTQLDELARKGEFQTWAAPLSLAMVYAELGREKEARAYMAKALESDRNLSLELIIHLSPFKNPAHLQRELDALRKAGLPEKPGGAVP